MTWLFLLLFGFSNKSHASEELTIIDVRRNITMSDEDPVYKDFYIKVGPNSGLKKNLVITAVRKVNLRDSSGASAVGEMNVPVGQLKVIAIYDKIAVAREYKILSRDDLPMLEQTAIMSGDSIDLQGAFIDNSKSRPKKVAEEPPAEATKPVETAIIRAEAVFKTQGPIDSKAAATESTKTTAENLEKTADSGNNTQHE